MRYVIGNLLESKTPVILHGCNAQGVMGSGVAKAIRDRYPWAYDEYRAIYERQSNSLTLGQVIPASDGELVVLNAITQFNYGRSPNTRYVSYDAVDDAMRNTKDLLRQFRAEFPVPFIAMPKIGAGLGNGDWGVIERIIDLHLGDDAIVYVLTRDEIPS